VSITVYQGHGKDKSTFKKVQRCPMTTQVLATTL